MLNYVTVELEKDTESYLSDNVRILWIYEMLWWLTIYPRWSKCDCTLHWVLSQKYDMGMASEKQDIGIY